LRGKEEQDFGREKRNKEGTDKTRGGKERSEQDVSDTF